MVKVLSRREIINRIEVSRGLLKQINRNNSSDEIRRTAQEIIRLLEEIADPETRLGE